MRTAPTRRRRLVIRSAIWLTLALSAALAAIGWALFTLGASFSTAIASAELASGAALQANNSWLLPAIFSVVVFAGVVLVAQRIAKNSLSSSPVLSSSRAQAQAQASASAPTLSALGYVGTPRHEGHAPAPVPFELRRPERAVSEVAGMLRPHD